MTTQPGYPSPDPLPPPPPPTPPKKHTARNVVLAAVGAMLLLLCGIAGIGALVGPTPHSTSGVTASHATRDSAPETTTAAPTPTGELGVATPAAIAEPTTPAAKPLSIEQQNAIQSAQDYLDYTAFSRKGLIQQLHSDAGEGYPLKVATFAVDSLHVNWNEQAYKAARAYRPPASPAPIRGAVPGPSSVRGDRASSEDAGSHRYCGHGPGPGLPTPARRP